MNEDLSGSFLRILRWEKVKRREEVIVQAFFYATLFSLAALPLVRLFPYGRRALLLFPVIFLILLPAFLFRRRWRERDSLRAIFQYDRLLELKERALTAWEISGRGAKPAELLVLEEAREKLGGIEPRDLRKRRLTMHAFLAPPLFLLWLLLVSFESAAHSSGSPNPAGPSMARRLKEFSSEIRERGKAEGLKESVKAAQALEEMAERALAGEVSEKRLSEDLQAMASQMGDLDRRAEEEMGSVLQGSPRTALLDLKMEVESLKQSLLLAPSEGKGALELRGSGGIGNFPRLRELEKALSPGRRLGERELRALIEKLERELPMELDRRALLEIRDFLASLLGGKGDQEKREASGVASRKAPEGSQKVFGSLPGDRPGEKARAPKSPPFSTASAATYLEGLLGEGSGASVFLRGEVKGRESRTSREEVLASYRKRAEEEIASEQVPEALKEVIKNYFLSVGIADRAD